MAIKFKEVKDRIEKTPFTQEELLIIKYSEEVVDAKIEATFKGGEVWVELGYANFTYRTDANKNPDFIPGFRKNLMFKELERRFNVAGWKCKVYRGEDDGPNRPAIDFWILTGKAKDKSISFEN